MKICTGCRGEPKPLSEFDKDPTGKHGRRAKCKACRRKYYADYFPVYRSRKKSMWQRIKAEL